MDATDLKKGSPYFLVTYEVTGCPIVLTFVFERSVGARPSERRHFFRYLPGFREERDETAEHPFIYTDEQLEDLQDLNGLVAKFAAL